MLKHVLFFMFMSLGLVVQAQNTGSGITGRITDKGTEALFGAAVLATHLPSGTVYGNVTGDNGRYTIPDMRVGGPYKVEVTYLGYQTATVENIYLKLGEKYSLDIALTSASVDIGEITITASGDGIIDRDKTGPSTNISREQLNNLPTISRSAADYTRLNPMAAEGGSFGGRNDQFNNYSVNGTIFNNPFGLDAATPGGQTDAQPISLDAIEQIQVAIAPFDVTQSGFTGASVNAVTKSGTNRFEGTVYGFFRNSSMIGGKVGDTEVERGDLTQSQYGFAVGGPIVKDKVFFFANLEFDNRSDLGSYFLPAGAGNTGSNVSRVLASDMQLISDLLQQTHNYETGAIQGFRHDSDNKKGLLRLDFNLGSKHKLSATYNFLDAFKDKPAHPSAIGRRGPDLLTLQFENSGYRINNVIHSGIVELKSVLSKKVSNKLQAGYTAFRDTRDPFSTPFPVLNISKNGSRYIVAGHEPFSINNNLNQNVLQFQNNLSIYQGDHTFTIGTSLEKFDFDNSFNLTGYGARVFFPDLDIAQAQDFIKSDDFKTEVANARAAYNLNNEKNTWALAETNVGQWALYVQDEYAVNERLTLTAGVRMDMPLYFDTKEKIEENIARKGGVIPVGTYAPDVTYYDQDGKPVKFDHTALPKATPLINPRVGLNYKIDATTQLRGGTGLFSGRFPFVWVGNQVANPDFFFYCVTDPDFKFPQVWRNNLGLDKKFENGWSTTIDVLHTKDINAQMVRNYGLNKPTGNLIGADTRPIYQASDRAQGPFGGATNAYVFTNTNLGYTFNTSVQIQKAWPTASFMVGYNFLDAKDAASIDAEISSDGYDRNPANVLNTNVAVLAPSLYGNRHRVISTFSKRFDYAGDRLGTTISLFAQYAQGGRFSYTYAGDINNDGSGLNDLMFIPTNAQIDAMKFTGDAAAQRTALKNYIAQDDYLSANRGQYAEKYGSLSPWYNNWDLRILQDIMVSSGNKFQISMDILNVGNMINSAWGVRQFATYTGLVQPLAVSVDKGEALYSFDTSQKSTFFNDFSTLSRWQMQLGLRYIFK